MEKIKSRRQLDEMMDFMHLKPMNGEDIGGKYSSSLDYDCDM